MKTKLTGLLLALVSLAGTAFSQEAPWFTDYAKAVEQAKKDNKALLLDFTGSDWCGWCMKMKKEVLDTKEFADYAAKNLVLVEVDFPRGKQQAPEVKKQNEELKAKYAVEGFPTFVLISKTGRQYGLQSGYLEGGPQAFIDLLNKWHRPSAHAAP